MMEDLEERLSHLERRLDHYDVFVQRLIAFARLTKGGRACLKALGLS